MCDPVSIALGTAMGATGTGAAVVGGLTLANTALGAYSAYSQTMTARGQAEYQSAVAKNNATLAEYERADTIARGEEAVQSHYRKVAELRGQQTVSAAARGLDITTGTPADTLAATDYFGRVDAQRIQDNYARKAWGSEMEAANYRSSSGMYSATAKTYSPTMSAGISLLGSGANVSDKWLRAQG